MKRSALQPSLSIGLPVYNGEAYLEAALEGLLAQGFEDFEVIISDNASTDRTPEICQRYVSADARVSYERQDVNRGAAWNYNRTCELARGRYFKWATHDDLCLPGFLDACVSTLEGAPESVVLVYSRAEFIDDAGCVIQADLDRMDTRDPRPHRRVASVLRRLNQANALTGVMRAKALKQTRRIGSFIASDYVLLAELAMLGEIWEIPETLFRRRLHRGASRTANQSNAEVLAWFDPNQKLQWRRLHSLYPRGMVRLRLMAEWVYAALQSPLTRKDKALCLMAMPMAYGSARLRAYAGLWRRRLGMARPWSGRQTPTGSAPGA